MLSWQKSNFGNGHSEWARPRPDLEYAIDVFGGGIEIDLSITAEDENILFERSGSVAAAKRKAARHFGEILAAEQALTNAVSQGD